MKQYFVRFSGTAIVEAEDEDDACKIATENPEFDEIDAYEIDKEGYLLKNGTRL